MEASRGLRDRTQSKDRHPVHPVHRMHLDADRIYKSAGTFLRDDAEIYHTYST
jgi:hypothetical protein